MIPLFSGKGHGLARFLITSILAVAFILPASAQNKITVTGRVVDSDNQPVVGAAVVVAGTNQGVSVDLDGRYTITVDANAKLVVSSLGYKEQTIDVAGKKTINVVLASDALMLEDAIAIGYGAQTRRQDLSASVGVIKSVETIAQRPVASTEEMLQGQLAGVTVSSNGGDPTSTPNIVIRGQGSRNGDSVLWVVDGVPGAPIVSNNDIESIVVLKDAASAAIYGANSGAGGVILVTTKKAKAGEPSVSYDGVYGVRQATNLITPLNAEQELEMRKVSYANAGLDLPYGWDTSKNPWVSQTRTDWMDEIFRPGFYNRHNVAVNMGTEKFQNRISFSVDNNDGVLISTYNKKMGVRYNGSYQINKYIKISEDLAWKTQTGRGANTSSGHSGAIISALFMPASATVYSDYTAGGYGGVTTEDPAYLAKYGSNYADIHGDAINPVRILEASDQFSKNNQFYTTTNLEIANIVKGLKFNSRYYFSTSNSYSKSFDPKRDEIGKPELANSLSESSSLYETWKLDNTLSYDRTFGKHSVGALFANTLDHYYGRYLSANGKDFTDESEVLQYFAYAGSTTVSDGLAGPDANVSLVGRLSYSYDDRYFVTATMRRDWAGRLPKDNNYGDFPGVTAAWKISSEKFFNKDIVNLLKVRASWGRIGNLGSISMNYKSATLNKDQRSDIASIGIENRNPLGTLVYYNNAVNPNLTWETSEQWDLGVDIDIMNELSMSVDYFNKRTFNLIQEQTMGWPDMIGFNKMLINQGEIRNSGVEFQASWNHKINKDWNVWVNGNFTYLKNEVISTGLLNDDGTYGVWNSGSTFRNVPFQYQTCVGGPLNQFYLIKNDGIFQSQAEIDAYTKDGKKIQPNARPGDLKFIDYNNDGKINDADRQYCGNADPDFTYALSGGFRWKDLTFSMMLQGVQGTQAIYAAKYMLVNDQEGNFNRSVDILDAWSTTNTGSNIPILSKTDSNGNFTTASDWYLEDASYLRIKNVTVSYDLTKLLRKAKHFDERNSSFSVYFSGDNLFTFTKYSGMDPECGGWDALKYPVSRVLSLGVKITY